MIYRRVANENDFDSFDPDTNVKFGILKVRRRVALIKAPTFNEQAPGHCEVARDKVRHHLGYAALPKATTG